MKNLLIYQSTEYDCGPTTLTNAIRYLFAVSYTHLDVYKRQRLHAPQTFYLLSLSSFLWFKFLFAFIRRLPASTGWIKCITQCIANKVDGNYQHNDHNSRWKPQPRL